MKIFKKISMIFLIFFRVCFDRLLACLDRSCSLFRQVLSAAAAVAPLACWHQIVRVVCATSVNLDQVIEFGGLSAATPITHRVLEHFAAHGFPLWVAVWVTHRTGQPVLVLVDVCRGNGFLDGFVVRGSFCRVLGIWLARQ